MTFIPATTPLRLEVMFENEEKELRTWLLIVGWRLEDGRRPAPVAMCDGDIAEVEERAYVIREWRPFDSRIDGERSGGNHFRYTSDLSFRPATNEEHRAGEEWVHDYLDERIKAVALEAKACEARRSALNAR